MYNKLSNKYKNYLKININLIDKNIISYSKTKYATIHIRYGDKIKLSIENQNKIIYPLYTPQYYYNQIIKIKKLNLPIIILTDSINIVNKFIIKYYNLENDKDIFIPDINFLNSFYILKNSSYTVLSHSTFSYAAFLLQNDHLNKTYIFCLTNKYYSLKFKLLDFLISNKWVIIDNDKYILNYNKKLLKKMSLYLKK